MFYGRVNFEVRSGYGGPFLSIPVHSIPVSKRTRAKSRAVTVSLSPEGRAYTRALKSEKALSPPITVGGGAVDTNDWCITSAIFVCT